MIDEPLLATLQSPLSSRLPSWYVGDESEDPRTHAAVAPERCGAGEAVHERILQYVFGVGDVSRHAQRDAKYGFSVFSQQFTDCVAIALLAESVEQQSIGIVRSNVM